MNNKPVAWARQDGVIAFHKQKEVDSQGFKWFPLYTHPVSQYKAITNTKIEPTVVSYTHPVKEQSTNERIEMLKEMVEKSANPVGWIGYQEGHLVSFLRSREQVNSFLTATDPTGRVEPVYTHPVKDLEDIDINITWNENSMRDFGKDELNFAKAILRKAQEK